MSQRLAMMFRSVLVAAFVFLPVNVGAVALVTAYKAPLTSPYVPCGDETRITDCTTGSMTIDSPWTFSAGTIVIDDDEVSLRLDDIRIRDGLDCATDVGDANACNCWDDNNGTCSTNGSPDCTNPVWCGPNAGDQTDNDYFIVYIYMQDKYDYWGTEKIRRNINCHPEVAFDLKKTANNSNRQVNQTVSVNIEGCGINSDAHGVEIRHVEVKDKYGNMVAKTTH